MSSLYEQMDFILSGGALNSLSGFLSSRVSAALIVTPVNADLEIADAVGTKTDGLFLRGWAPKLASAFPPRAKNKKFEVIHAPVTSDNIEGEWQWAVAVRGKRWAFYVLLRETPEPLLAELMPVAGLVALWQEFQYMETAEKRLSQLAYMILATKSTLASIFEPVPLSYYASFLMDVLNESLFPRSLSIFKDDGAALIPLAGENAPPERKGIYAQKMLPSTPIVTKSDSSPYEVALPIVEPHQRLFCVMQWDNMPEKETLSFLELIGNLASRALAISSLRSESEGGKGEISSGKYTILTLSKALNALKSRKNRHDLLSMTADIVTEMTKVRECLLVAWNKELGGYVPFDYRKDDIKTSCDSSLLRLDRVRSEAETQFFDFPSREFSELLYCPWPEMSAMKLVFPIWDRGRMDGFIAVSSDQSAMKDGNKLSALVIIAQFTAFALRNFDCA
ncbi:MAG: hypothetical protein FWG71_03655 [Synergistaceae bacterium]|nr:hypothetical protein [Synergistaceae bacterium]